MVAHLSNATSGIEKGKACRLSVNQTLVSNGRLGSGEKRDNMWFIRKTKNKRGELLCLATFPEDTCFACQGTVVFL